MLVFSLACVNMRIWAHMYEHMRTLQSICACAFIFKPSFCREMNDEYFKTKMNLVFLLFWWPIGSIGQQTKKSEILLKYPNFEVLCKQPESSFNT